jgi:hypothetical protein
MQIAATVPICFLMASGATLDRIAVTVDKQVVTESEVIRDVRVAAFLDRKPVDLSAQARREAAGRLVDQILIGREAADSHFTLPSIAEAASLVDQQKSQYPSVEDYRAALEKYRITEADLAIRLLDGLRALRFTDLRFLPAIQNSDKELRDYYETLAADWRKTNPAHVPAFEESREQVDKLLTGERAMQALDRWLAAEHSQSRIEYREAAFK